MLTLGINYSQMHDSSACIVRDGELLFAVAEERLSRLKHDASFPHLAIRACLDFAKCNPDQLDEVCFGWPAPGPLFRHDLKCFATRRMPFSYLNLLNSARYFASMWYQGGGAFQPRAAQGRLGNGWRDPRDGAGDRGARHANAHARRYRVRDS